MVSAGETVDHTLGIIKWVKDGSSEELLVWSNELSVGLSGLVSRDEVVDSATTTDSESTSWEVGLTRVGEVWSLGSEVGVGTVTRWVSHDVGVVLGWVKVLVDGGLVSLVAIGVLKPVSPVLKESVHVLIEDSKSLVGLELEVSHDSINSSFHFLASS